MEFKALIPTLEFTPTSYDEYMQPYILAETAYQQRKKELDDRDEILAKYLPYINDSTPEAKRLYDAAQQQLQRNLEQLGRKGWNLNPQPLIDFKKQYRETNARLEKASTDLAEQMKADKEAVVKDPTMYIAYKDKSGAFVKPNIDNMLLEDTTRHFVSGKDVQANAAKSAAALSERTKAAFSNMYKTPNDEVGYYSVTQGKMAGVSSKVMMDWMMRPDDFKKEINDYLKSVKAFGGKDAADKMSALFSGDFRRAMDSVLDMTDYDNMTDSDKLRINKHLWSGAYQGLSYDETVQKNIQQYYHPERTPAGGGGGDDAPTIDPTPAKTSPQVFEFNDKRDKDALKTGRERINKLKNFLGINDDYFAETGMLDFRISGKYGLPKGGRTYGGGDSVARNSQAVDKFIDDPNVIKSGIKDFFYMFDDNGKLLGEDSFVASMSKTLAELNSDSYFDTHSTDENYGNLYLEAIRSQSGAQDFRDANDANNIDKSNDLSKNVSYNPENKAKEIYVDIKHAVLDAFDVPEKEQEQILKDKQKWEKFVADHDVNEATFQNAVTELWDKYANVETQMQYINFAENNKLIINDVMKNIPKEKNRILADHDYVLSPVTADSYKFETKNVNGRLVKELKIVPGKKTGYDKEDLFGKGDDANYNCFYFIPPDPSQGLLVKFPTGKAALIEPKLLGSLYPADKIKEVTQKNQNCRSLIEAAVSKIKRYNTELQKYKQEKHSEEEKQAKEVEITAKITQMKEAIETNMDSIRKNQSSITELIRDTISLYYKNNPQ